MACNHDRIRCTDNVFYCLVCGAKVEMPVREEKPVEAKKTAVKRKSKKEGE
jgi:hypothetical protein